MIKMKKMLWLQNELAKMYSLLNLKLVFALKNLTALTTTDYIFKPFQTIK